MSIDRIDSMSVEELMEAFYVVAVVSEDAELMFLLAQSGLTFSEAQAYLRQYHRGGPVQ